MEVTDKIDPYERSINTIRKKLIAGGLSNGEATYVINKFRKAIKNCDCVDNFRMAINNIGIERYEEIKQSGCCGFHDDRIVLRTGNVVDIGFNYGH